MGTIDTRDIESSPESQGIRVAIELNETITVGQQAPPIEGPATRASARWGQIGAIVGLIGLIIAAVTLWFTMYPVLQDWKKERVPAKARAAATRAPQPKPSRSLKHGKDRGDAGHWLS